MLNRGILMFCSAALLIVLLPAQLAAQGRVVDLTNTAPNLAEWKIVASEAGGPVGTWPMPPSYLPVTVHLTNCVVRNAELYFSIQIQNDRKLEVQVPVSMNSKLFDRRGTITFRELLIRLGTATNTRDLTTFKIGSGFAEIMLFGDRSVPGTIAVLAPGERLVLQLKSQAWPKDQDLSSLRVNIAGSDARLSPSGDGYTKREIWIPALFATSESTCSDSKRFK
jgi:hypothetical protein